MKIITISTQAEFDALPVSFSEFTQIQITNTTTRLSVSISRENSSVEAWENSSVEAWGNSSVVAWGNSSVVARENVGIHNYSELTSIILFGYSALWVIKKAKTLIKKSSNVTIIYPPSITTANDWISNQGVEINNKKVILFKRVSSDFKTQENTKNETHWEIGTSLVHPDYHPSTQECGEGKFHACSRPYFCNQFRKLNTDKYIALEIDIDDLYAWPDAQYPYKIAFRAGTVLHQCDRRGNKI